MNEVKLDAIPFNLNNTLPKKEEYWHFLNKSSVPVHTIKEFMLSEIQHKFKDSDYVIVIENGIVIKVIINDN